MEPADLTLRVLKEIREDIRGLREDNRAVREDNRALREDFQAFAAQAAARFETIETALRDMAEQLAILARGVKTLLEHRRDTDARVDDHERRIDAIEKQLAR